MGWGRRKEGRMVEFMGGESVALQKYKDRERVSGFRYWVSNLVGAADGGGGLVDGMVRLCDGSIVPLADILQKLHSGL